MDLIMSVAGAHGTPVADVCWDPFQCHDSDGTCLLRNSRLLDIDNIHDDATFEHLRESGLLCEMRAKWHVCFGGQCVLR